MRDHTMILTAQQDRVRTITLNRPDDLNPLSWQVLNEVASELDAARDDANTAVIVIEAAGKAFSTGYDLREEHWITSQYPANFPDHVDIRRDRDDVHTIVDYWMNMWRYPKPIIAKVQGDCCRVQVNYWGYATSPSPANGRGLDIPLAGTWVYHPPSCSGRC